MIVYRLGRGHTLFQCALSITGIVGLFVVHLGSLLKAVWTHLQWFGSLVFTFEDGTVALKSCRH
jgi:hypothetical protein